MNNPFNLTDQEIAELTSMMDSLEVDSNWNDRSWDTGGRWNDDYDYERPNTKKRQAHEWIKTTLIISTVETCKHCGAKKEKTHGSYCEDSDDTGGW